MCVSEETIQLWWGEPFVRGRQIVELRVTLGRTIIMVFYCTIIQIIVLAFVSYIGIEGSRPLVATNWMAEARF